MSQSESGIYGLNFKQFNGIEHMAKAQFSSVFNMDSTGTKVLCILIVDYKAWNLHLFFIKTIKILVFEINVYQ